MRRALY